MLVCCGMQGNIKASNNSQRVLFPVNEKNAFKVNQFFRKLTKNKIQKRLKLNIKGREFIINNFYEGIAKFDFNNLCNANLGAEDYIKIAESCKFIVLQKILFSISQERGQFLQNSSPSRVPLSQ